MKKFFVIICITATVASGTINASWLGNLFRDMPAMDMPSVTQSDDNVIVSMRVPDSIDSDDISVEINNKTQTLYVYGKSEAKKEVQEEGFYKKEMSSNSFNRSVSLPCMVDELLTAAELKDGLLVVTMPKLKEEDRSAKKIKVVRV
jgi:HSP20 family protein